MMKQNIAMMEGDEIVKTKTNTWNKCRAKVCSNKKLAIVTSVITVLLVLAIALYFALRPTAGDDVRFNSSSGIRLPGNVIPSHYVLEVKVYMTPENFTFEGSVQITFKCFQKTDIIILHSKGLSFRDGDIRIRSADSSYPRISELAFNRTNDFVILKLERKLKISTEYVIFFKYNGTMRSDADGLFYSSYTGKDSATHYLVNTQFEPVQAREVFPCFDEPEFKATFDITIVRRRSMTSLSNMPKIRTENRGNGWVADKYLTTMKMSTYLVAFAVGKYVGIKEDKVAIWAPTGLNESSKFALDITVMLLKRFEDLLDVPYEPPKLDIAAAIELSGEAMENWGLVIALKTTLLMNSNTDPAAQQRYIAQTVAHEIAHQWFGNLVTMKWWSDLWLNEGLASYMEEMALRYFCPELHEKPLVRKASTLVFSCDCCPAWKFDVGIPGIYGVNCSDFSEHSSSTVWKNITRAKDLHSSKLFDPIVYYKGAMIISMVHHVLDNETFWKFLSIYLKRNAYGNVDGKDFWEFVSKAQSNKKYTRFDMSKMSTWTHLPGIPILSARRNYKENSVTFSQESCRRIDLHKGDLWHIPISYRTSKNGTWNLPRRMWLSGRNTTSYNMPSERDWILANDEASEYYIVNYDKHNWQLLASQLKKNHTVFTSRQRYKILADAVNLFGLNYSEVPIEVLLSLYTYLRFEKEWQVFEKPNSNLLLKLQTLMVGNNLRSEWKEFTMNIFGPVYDEFVRGNGTFSTDIIHQLIYWLCQFKYSACVEDALTTAENWKNGISDETKISKYGLGFILCIAVRESDSISTYLYEEYEKSRKGRVESAILEALFCGSNSSVIGSLLQEYEKSRSVVFLRVMQYLMDNEEHWPMLFDFIDEHFLRITNNIRTYNTMNSWFLVIRSSPVQAEKLLEILKKHVSNVSNRRFKSDIEREIENLEINIPKMKLIVSRVENWLKKDYWRTR